MTITNKMIESAIKKLETLENGFDSHRVILLLAHDNQRDYIESLYQIQNERPFQTLHTSLGIKIKEICLEKGFTPKECHSNDIFGQNSKCLSWRK